MPQVLGFHYELYCRLTVRTALCIHAADVGVVVGNNCSQFFQHAGAIVAEDCNLDGIALPAACNLVAHPRPRHCKAAIALVEQILDVGAAPRMHGHSLAASNVADDFLSANGIATPSA